MSTVEEKLWAYGLLSPEEQAEVDAFVAAHPEWAPAREQARALAGLLRDARLLDEAAPGDEALAYHLAARHLGPPPPAWADAYRRIEERLEADPQRRARYEDLERRLDELEAASDPAAQFERLSGYALDPPTSAAPPAPGSQRAPDRVPRRTSQHRGRLPRLARWTSAIALAAVGLYGALFALSYGATPPNERLAAFEPDEVRTDIYGRRDRGAAPQPDSLSTEALFLQALPLLQEARTSTLGLFPRYDEAKLQRAGRLLERIIAQEDPGFARAEAYYLLGKVRLAQGDVQGARDALRRVVTGEGAGPGLQADEAERLLRSLAQRRGSKAGDGEPTKTETRLRVLG